MIKESPTMSVQKTVLWVCMFFAYGFDLAAFQLELFSMHPWTSAGQTSLFLHDVALQP